MHIYNTAFYKQWMNKNLKFKSNVNNLNWCFLSHANVTPLQDKYKSIKYGPNQ